MRMEARVLGGLFVAGAIFCSLAEATPAGAQGLLDKAKDAVKKTSIGQSVSKLGAEAKLLDATTVQLDSRNLPTVQVGMLKLGISAVEIKNGEAVRLKLYLFNPTPQAASVPSPPPDLFVLVDEHGRKLEMLAPPAVKDVPAGGDITVPGMERTELAILFGEIAADARVGNLKVGTAGIISGIPIHTSAAGAAAKDPNQAGPWR